MTEAKLCRLSGLGLLLFLCPVFHLLSFIRPPPQRRQQSLLSCYSCELLKKGPHESFISRKLGADRRAGLRGGAPPAASPAAPSLTALMSLTRRTSSHCRFISGLVESEKTRLIPAEIDCEDTHTHTGAQHRQFSCFLTHLRVILQT